MIYIFRFNFPDLTPAGTVGYKCKISATVNIILHIMYNLDSSSVNENVNIWHRVGLLYIYYIHITYYRRSFKSTTLQGLHKKKFWKIVYLLLALYKCCRKVNGWNCWNCSYFTGKNKCSYKSLMPYLILYNIQIISTPMI